MEQAGLGAAQGLQEHPGLFAAAGAPLPAPGRRAPTSPHTAPKQAITDVRATDL